MDCRQSMANTGQRERIVTHTADHILRLPKVSSRDATPRVECIQPAKTDESCRGRWLNVLGLLSFPAYETERWCQRAELRGGNKSEIDLQGIGEQEYAINPRTGMDVKMIERLMPIVHMRGPIGQDFLQLSGILDPKG